MLRLDRETFADVLSEYGLWSFPRRFGYPHSVTVGNPNGFFTLWDRYKDEPLPLLLAHNAFAPVDPGARLNVSKYVHRVSFADMDTGDGNGCTPSDVWDEVCRVDSWLRKQAYPFAWKYSGSECGFHLHVFSPPTVFGRDYLSQWENAFWRGLMSSLKLRSINIRCANPLCMERIPFSRYVHKKDKDAAGYKAEANFCVPFPHRLVEEQDLAAIKLLSAHPAISEDAYKFQAEPVGLEDMVRKHGWTTFAHELRAIHPEVGPLPQGQAVEINKLYIPVKKCLQTLPFGTNPRHAVRLAWITEICALGVSLDEAINLCDKIAEEAGWIDRMNVDVRHQQVEHAWRKGYHPWSCPTLRENGICVGPSCELFKKAFPEEWKEIQAKEAKKEP
jgi:hypothetical protein